SQKNRNHDRYCPRHTHLFWRGGQSNFRGIGCGHACKGHQWLLTRDAMRASVGVFGVTMGAEHGTFYTMSAALVLTFLSVSGHSGNGRPTLLRRSASAFATARCQAERNICQADHCPAGETCAPVADNSVDGYSPSTPP